MTTKSETKTATRAALHCHSTASAVSKLGVQRALGLPECATPPEEVYALAKRRGMDFVTITDHDTIDGALEIADRPDVFVSEELTARFAGEPQAVHIPCFGITAGDHDGLQARAGDVEQVAEYLREQEIASALAHPFYAVEAPVTARPRRRLAELFGVWEVRNGARAPELNAPAAVYVDTHGGTGVGGSDDHAGVDIGRTWTEAPAASSPSEFLDHLRAGRVDAHGKQGSAAMWAHAAMAIALRTYGPSEGAPPDPGDIAGFEAGGVARIDHARDVDHRVATRHQVGRHDRESSHPLGRRGVVNLVADDLADRAFLETLIARGAERGVEVVADPSCGASVGERVAGAALAYEELRAAGCVCLFLHPARATAGRRQQGAENRRSGSSPARPELLPSQASRGPRRGSDRS